VPLLSAISACHLLTLPPSISAPIRYALCPLHYADFIPLPHSDFQLQSFSPSQLLTFCPSHLPSFVLFFFHLPHSHFRLLYSVLPAMHPALCALLFFPTSAFRLPTSVLLTSAFLLPTSALRHLSSGYTGIGATTWDDTNIQVTRAALSRAPR
jgi:hypothetical protein